ncbi:hypothetical protein F4801DRAFT_535031 [Xylaria longipes]|nr:hypothetical protein F4801DRAFT_535031 [Xylaria longipes]
MADDVAQLRREVAQLTASISALERSIRESETRLRATIQANIQAKTELRATIHEAETRLNASIQDVKASLEHAIEDCDFNNRARAANTLAFKPETYISPLRNTTTHEVVELPATRGELDALDPNDVTNYLQRLNQELERRGDELKQLKAYIGAP